MTTKQQINSHLFKNVYKYSKTCESTQQHQELHPEHINCVSQLTPIRYTPDPMFPR